MTSNNRKKLDIAIISVLTLGLLYSIFIAERTDTAYNLLAKTSSKTIKDSEKLIKSANATITEKDLIIADGKEKIKAKDLEILKLKFSLKQIQDIKNANIQKVDKYSRTDLSRFYVERYNLPSQIKETASGIEFGDTVTKLNAKELVSFDGTKMELAKTNQILAKTEAKVADLDTIVSAYESETEQYVFVIQQKDTIIKAKDNLVVYAENEKKKAEKATKKEKVKKNFWKAACGIITAAAIYLQFKPF